MRKLAGCMLLAIALVGCNEGSTTAPTSESSAPSAAASLAIALPPLTPQEQSELTQISSAGKLAGELGHDISENTRLSVLNDNFGERIGCVISVRAQSQDGGLSHPRWNLRVQVGRGVQGLVWTSNILSNDAGEVRLTVASERFSLSSIVNDEGGRGIELNRNLLNDLLSSDSAKAVSGVIGDDELSSKYDLRSFKKAYKFASAMCA